jgi:hypothetical protein
MCITVGSDSRREVLPERDRRKGLLGGLLAEVLERNPAMAETLRANVSEIR